MDMTTSYMGISLKSPLVASAGPLNADLDHLKRLEDHGAGAVVLPSIFEEQIAREQALLDDLMLAGIDSNPEGLSYFPPASAFDFNTQSHLELVSRAAAALEIPVIASLNGTTDHGWIEHAVDVERAGASAIELNIYFIPSDPNVSGAAVEQRYVDVVGAVKAAVRIPVAVKIGPYFSSPGHMARRLADAGADALVLFNRFYEPDIDLASLSVVPSLELSKTLEMRLPLLWIGILYGRLGASLAGSTGVETAEDVIKYLMVGADVVMTTSSILRHGAQHMRVLNDGLAAWLDARNLDGPADIRGRLSHAKIHDPEAFERANYVRILQGYAHGHRGRHTRHAT